MSYDKDTIKRMTWDEIQNLMEEKIKNGSWNEYVETLGKPPHVIKHDYFIEEMNRKKDESNIKE